MFCTWRATFARRLSLPLGVFVYASGQALNKATTVMGTEPFTTPWTMLVALGIVALISSLYFDKNGLNKVFTAKSLSKAYLHAAICCAALVAIEQYSNFGKPLTFGKALSPLKWDVVFRQYWVMAMLLSSCALIGIAVVGLPIIMLLNRFGRATVLWVLLATVPPSCIAAVLLSSGVESRFQHIEHTLKEFLVMHLLIAFAFCRGASLPWRKVKSGADSFKV
jgi:hypothetical protein